MRVALNLEQCFQRPPGGIGRYAAELARLLPETADPADGANVDLVPFVATCLKAGMLTGSHQAVPLFWFNELDGRGPMPVRESIRHVRAGGVIGIFPEGRIVQPRGETPVFRSRRTTVLEKYRAGQSPETIYPNRDQGRVSDVGQ